MRHFFGYGASDFAMAPVGTSLVLVPGATGSVWDSVTGGTQITDLTDVNSSPITSLTADENAQVAFYGPDGVSSLYVDFGFGIRFLMTATDLGPLLDSKASLDGAEFVGPVTLAADPTDDLEAATKAYVDAVDLTDGGEVDGPLTVNATNGSNSPPLGVAGAVHTGLNVISSYAGGDDDGTGTDSTGRLNLYSYQRANTYSFGESIRHFLMRADAKTMQAFYMPVQSANKKGGYDGTTRDPKTSGIGWKPVVWQGAHYEANDHGSIHGHWELEIADSNGALQGRLEIPFIDQAADGSTTVDNATIGVDYANIRTNLADLSVRAQNIASGPYSGQTTCLRVGGGNDRNKEIHLSISSDMGTASRRWVLRANSTTEAGSNAGTDFQLLAYDDTGTLITQALHAERKTGNVGMGTVSPDARLHVKRNTGQVVHVEALATTQSAILVDGVDATVKALQAQVAGDTVKRFQILTDGTVFWGSGSAAQDTNLYRSAANVLKTDDKLIAALGLGVGNSASATTLGTLSKKMEVFDASGTSLGFVPIYDSIS